MALFNIARTISGAAKVLTGSTKDFRKILEANSGLISFALPPQVAMGIKVANQLGIRIPSPDSLIKSGTTELNKILKGINRESVAVLDKVDATSAQIAKGAEKAQASLDSIDWLL
jgi:hypothetical protein